MSDQTTEDQGTIIAYQGMKISQVLDRLSQLEHIVMKVSNASNENTRKLIEEITVLKNHTNYVPPGIQSLSNVPAAAMATNGTTEGEAVSTQESA